MRLTEENERLKSMLDWLIDHLHLLEVNTDAAYCDEQRCPAASFRSLHVVNGRPWCKKGESRTRLIAAIEEKMVESLRSEPKIETPNKCIVCGKDSGHGSYDCQPVCFDCYESGALKQ